MEEVDSIIIDFLKKIQIDIPEGHSVCDMPVELIIESAAKCLKTINPSLKVPLQCPRGISQRIEVAAQIATLCKDIGYKNDVGYQTFLYCNEADLRQVFMFLIEHLPNENNQTSIATVEKADNKLLRNISQRIEDELNKLWVPRLCYAKKDKHCHDFFLGKDKSKTVNFNDDYLVQKLLEAKQLNTDKELFLEEKEQTQKNICLMSDSKNIESKINAIQITESLKELTENVYNLKQVFDNLESDKNLMEFEYVQSMKKVNSADAELKNVQEILNSVGLKDPTAESAISLLEKVQNGITNLHLKSENLNSKIFDIKQEIEKMKNQHSMNSSERTRCKNILSNLKVVAKSLKEEFESKTELQNQLIRNHDKIKSGNKRSLYTKRIMEIISNVDKQNLEICKVLDDTRQLQKDINSLEGQLDRCFSIADEILFRDATKDDEAKKAYKLLALLHSECNTIVSLINDTGTLAREMVDLEDNIKTEKAKKGEDILQRIKNDINELEQENYVLLGTYRS